MTIAELILDWWPIAAFAISYFAGIVVWGLRLESLVKMNQRETEHLEKRLDIVSDDVKKSYEKIDARLIGMNATLEKIIFRLPRPSRDDDTQ